MPTQEHLARIRWNCRRGMLELDVILEDFFEQHYLQLSASDQNLFDKLLMCTDQELYEWLMGKKPVADAEFVNIVALIRQSRKK